MAITDKEINLNQLDQELNGHGLVADFNDAKNKVILAAEGSPITEKELEEAIKNHVAIDEIAELNNKKNEILTKLGISEDDAKILLMNLNG